MVLRIGQLDASQLTGSRLLDPRKALVSGFREQYCRVSLKVPETRTGFNVKYALTLPSLNLSSGQERKDRRKTVSGLSEMSRCVFGEVAPMDRVPKITKDFQRQIQ